LAHASIWKLIAERRQVNQQNWHGQDRDHGGRSYRSNVESYNCDKYGYYAKECYAKKKVEENANLVEEDETKDEGILMMANEVVILDSDMVWYLDTSVSNHMCGNKHLLLVIQEIEDGHVSFGDSTKVPIKGRGENMFFSHERSDFALEGQKWTSSCKRGDDEESDVHNLKSTLPEKSLCDDKIMLEGLRKQSSSLEELCNLLNNEKHNLLNERSVLVSKLESVEAKFDKLEKKSLQNWKKNMLLWRNTKKVELIKLKNSICCFWHKKKR